MIAFFRRTFTKLMEYVVSTVKKLTLLATLFSFPVLFVLFFIYLSQGKVLEALACLAGIYAFVHLNRVL